MLNKYLFITIAIAYCSHASSAEPTADSSLNAPIHAVGRAAADNASAPLSLDQMLAMLDESKETNIKLDNKGFIQITDTKHWDCLHQKTSGLTWEIKTNSGLRDKTNTYTWIINKPNQGEWMSWFENTQGKCTGSARCETADYIAKINQQRLCNFSDWRLPTKKELESLIKMGAAKEAAKINSQYFPNTQASWYWTADINENYPDYAWYVLFKNGVTLSDKKLNPKHVRLVRGNL